MPHDNEQRSADATTPSDHYHSAPAPQPPGPGLAGVKGARVRTLQPQVTPWPARRKAQKGLHRPP